MKKIVHILPCGAIHTFKEYGYKDMAKRARRYMLKSFSKNDMNKVCKADNYGRKLIPWTDAVYSKLMNSIWHEVTEHILDANRVIIPYKKIDTILYIGKINENPNRIAKRYKKQRVNFADEGKRYSTILDGVSHSYYFRLSRKNRHRLYRLIKEGKNYH